MLAIGSGNMVHNLRMIDFTLNRQRFDRAVEIDAVVHGNWRRTGDRNRSSKASRVGKSDIFVAKMAGHTF